MDKVARSNCERPLYVIRDPWRGYQLGKPQYMNLSEIRSLMFTQKVFSPGKVIFAGLGVLLSVRILLDNMRGPS